MEGIGGPTLVQLTRFDNNSFENMKTLVIPTTIQHFNFNDLPGLHTLKTQHWAEIEEMTNNVLNVSELVLSSPNLVSFLNNQIPLLAIIIIQESNLNELELLHY